MITEMLEHLNQGVPSKYRWKWNPSCISRYGNFKAAVLAYHKMPEKQIKECIWEFKFSEDVFADMQDEVFLNFYRHFSHCKNRQM